MLGIDVSLDRTKVGELRSDRAPKIVGPNPKIFSLSGEGVMRILL
jgi:hypothetical protein